MFTLYHDSPFALNLQAAFWLTCAHYIIRTYSHPSTHESALSRSTALLRMAVRSLMAQEKNMSASQPHSFLLRSLYHTFLQDLCLFLEFSLTVYYCYCSRVGTFGTESAVRKRGGSRNNSSAQVDVYGIWYMIVEKAG